MSEFSFRWFVLTVDVSLKVCLLAASAGFGLWALRVRNSNARHATWLGVLWGILAIPLLAPTLPGIALPLPGRLNLFVQNEWSSSQPVERVSPDRATPIVANKPAVLDNVAAKRQPSSLRLGSPERANTRVTNDSQPANIAFSIANSVLASPKAVGNESTRQIAAVEPKELASSDPRTPIPPQSDYAVRFDWPLMAAAIWAIGVLVLAIRLMLGLVVMRGLVRRSEPVFAPSSTSGQTSVEAAIEIRECSEVVVPVTVGVIHSTVLLPSAWKTWTVEKLRDVLAHEQAHVRRRDCLTAFLADLAVAVYWFHPIAWRRRKRLALLAEEACDDAAIGSTGNRTAYARHLLEIVSVPSGRPGRLVAPGVSMARQSNIETRINAILDFNRPLSCRMTWTATLMIAAAVVPLVSVAAALRPAIRSQPEVRAGDPLNGVTLRAAQSTVSPNRTASIGVALADPPRPAESRLRSQTRAPESSDQELLTITGRVLRPDGSPASGARITLIGRDEPGPTVRADVDGHFSLSDVFGTRCFLHAHTPDGRQQATFPISPAGARIIQRNAIELKLSPAIEQHVLVTAGGTSVGGVRVIASGGRFVAEGRSGSDGRATLLLPAGETVTDLDAWDPKLGGAGRHCVGGRWDERPEELLQLSLLAPNPQRIRVVDQNARPIPGLRFWITCSSRYTAFSTAQFDEAAVQTDLQGEVTVRWMPTDIRYIGMTRLGRSWKVDEVHIPSGKDRDITIVQIRRKRPVMGRLFMPSGASAEGILMTGVGYGAGHHGDAPTARARRDGTFTMFAASDHHYFLDITDQEWVSEPWMGTVMTSDEAKPAAIAMDVRRGIPLTVAAVKGPKSEPWAGVSIHGHRSQSFTGTDAHGQRRTFWHDLQFDLNTDAKGRARLAIRRGQYELNWMVGRMLQVRTVKANGDAPVFVTFDRPWLAERPIFGQIGIPLFPQPAESKATLRAWSDGGSPLPVDFFPGEWFTVASNAEHVWIYAKDSKAGCNAYCDLGPTSWRWNVSLNLEATGVYSGTVVDENGKPVTNCRVRLIHHPPGSTFSPEGVMLDEVACDDQGRFKFKQAPTEAPVCPVVVKPVANGPARVVQTVLRDLRLTSREAFTGDRIVVLEGSKPTAGTSKQVPRKTAAERLPDLLRDARLLHMKVLLVVEGDASKQVQEVSQKLLESEQEFPEILHYLPLVIHSAELKSEAPLLAGLNVRPPETGELLLLMADVEGRGCQEQLLPGGNVAAAFKLGTEFLKKHVPAPRDARKLVAAAQEEAKATRRAVWVIEAGPRSGPSFQLARWMDDQRTLLGYDYVFVPLLAGCDEHVEQVMRTYARPHDAAVPWFAIIDGRDMVLATSDGPRGNIGYPDTPAAKHYLRQMIDRTAGTMTAKEIDGLIQSLGD